MFLDESFSFFSFLPPTLSATSYFLGKKAIISLFCVILQMNIYFCGSIRGGRQDVAIYQQIVTCLKTYGQVLTEHVAFPELEICELK